MTSEEWELIGHYSRYRILGCGCKRRLEDPDTGKIIREYTVPVYRETDEYAPQENQQVQNPATHSSGPE